MDRVQLLLLGIPLFLFCSDLVSLFSPPPRPQRHHHHHHQPQPQPQPQYHHHQEHRPPQPPLVQAPDVSSPPTGGVGFGATVELNYCTSCSYRGNALTIKKMLETSFPGIAVILSNYPPPLPKRLLSKLVPVVQAGVFGIVMAGDQILPRLGYVALPPWYLSLRANRFGTIASTWLLGNVFQNFLQSSGAFEVYCNGDLVFSKLKENRFPGEIELRNLIIERIGNPRFGGEGNIWS
uniref:SelT-like protein n=1 Tax=Anthurium amnicola TaxID=1678845 RepID=A0A1D1YVG6_9ARAE